MEQSAFEAAQLLGRRQEKLAVEVEAAKARLRELTEKMQSLRSGLLEEVEGEGQVRCKQNDRPPANIHNPPPNQWGHITASRWKINSHSINGTCRGKYRRLAALGCGNPCMLMCREIC